MIDGSKDRDASGAPGDGPTGSEQAPPQAVRDERAETASAQEAGADTSSASSAEDVGLALLSAKLERLEAEKTDLIDRLLRAQAEMDNYRKRSEREREETARYAISKFARDVVGVADNFERAIAAVPQEALRDDPALGALLDGVRMTEREFLNALERHGVKRLAPTGEVFDPHFHQAVMEQQDAAVPAGTILQVFQSGYRIADRCLRPAMVVVSKGGPKQAKAAGEVAEPAEDGGPATGSAAVPTGSDGDTGGSGNGGEAPASDAPSNADEPVDGGKKAQG